MPEISFWVKVIAGSADKGTRQVCLLRFFMLMKILSIISMTFTLSSAKCPTVQLYNFAGELTEGEMQDLIIMATGCAVHVDNIPCLLAVIKTEKDRPVYQAVCGKAGQVFNGDTDEVEGGK